METASGRSWRPETASIDSLEFRRDLDFCASPSGSLPPMPPGINNGMVAAWWRNDTGVRAGAFMQVRFAGGADGNGARRDDRSRAGPQCPCRDRPYGIVS
jgi:hypothetical protein